MTRARREWAWRTRVRSSAAAASLAARCRHAAAHAAHAQKKMTQRSDRVKSVDMHPSEPWVLCALYTGKVVIYNYATGTTFKTFDVSEQPVRCAKFITRKQWFIAGSDDMVLRVFNYNTMERVAAFDGHGDYVRYLEVHPSHPFVLLSLIHI